MDPWSASVFRAQAVGFIDLRSGLSAAEQQQGVSTGQRQNDVASRGPPRSQPLAEPPQWPSLSRASDQPPVSLLRRVLPEQSPADHSRFTWTSSIGSPRPHISGSIGDLSLSRRVRDLSDLVLISCFAHPHSRNSCIAGDLAEAHQLFPTEPSRARCRG
jgi:hypothetical protein